MKWLYVENFRGFDKEFIPILDVNFLLGENSTGKSSVLALCNLFSSPFFWMQNNFNLDEFEFGNFRDIVSVNAEEQTFFRIGIIECQNSPHEGKVGNNFVALIEYVEKNSIPSISKYCYVSGANAIQMFLDSQNLMYKIDKIDFGKDISKAIMDVFHGWLDKVPFKRDMTILKGPRQVRRVRALPLLESIVEADAKIRQKNEDLLSMIRQPDLAHGFAWIAPIRSKPKRTYDQYKYSFSPEGDHTPYLIRRYLMSKKSKQGMDFQNFMKDFGQDSGLLSTIGVKKFGKESSSPFELDIVLDDKPLNISNVGYGVSQSLPILVELYARSKGSWFAIQQPEVHLHPRAQAALGEVFFFLAEHEKKRLLIETHSDFIIDRFRSSVRKSESTIEAQALFFERVGGFNKVHSIPILNDGRYSEDQPDSFRSFFIKEELDIMRIR